MSEDLFDRMANEEVAAPPSVGGSDLPDKLRVVVENCTAKHGGAAPKVKPYGEGANAFHKFEMGLVLVGGEEKAQPFAGRFIFYKTNVHKPTEERVQQWIDNATTPETKKRHEGLMKALPKLPLNGDLYNMILDTLAPEDGDVQNRWQLAFSKLKTMKEAKSYTTEAFDNDVQLLIATCFKDILLEQKFQVIGQTYTPKGKPTDKYPPQQTVGSIKAFNAANAAKQKVSVFAVGSEF